MEQLGRKYPWENEDLKYGLLPRNINRASDDSDSDIETPAERRLYLSERLKNKALMSEIKKDSPGLRVLIKQREMAKYEYKKRGYSDEDFDAFYPRFQFDRNHDFIKVIVSS